MHDPTLVVISASRADPLNGPNSDAIPGLPLVFGWDGLGIVFKMHSKIYVNDGGRSRELKLINS